MCLFAAKEAFETGVETGELAASVAPEQVVFRHRLKLEILVKYWRYWPKIGDIGNKCAGFRSALLKHATCTLPSSAGSTLSDPYLF